MKKLIIIPILLITMILNCQSVYTDSLPISSISGTDTTLFLLFRSDGGSIMFDFTNFDADDGTLDIGLSNDNTGYVTIDDGRIPVTLNTATWQKTANGVSKSRILIETLQWNAKFLVLKLTKNSVTSGTLIWKYVR